MINVILLSLPMTSFIMNWSAQGKVIETHWLLGWVGCEPESEPVMVEAGLWMRVLTPQLEQRSWRSQGSNLKLVYWCPPTCLSQVLRLSLEKFMFSTVPSSIPVLLTGLGCISARTWPRSTDSLTLSCLMCDEASGSLLRMGRKTESGWTLWCSLLQRIKMWVWSHNIKTGKLKSSRHRLII